MHSTAYHIEQVNRLFDGRWCWHRCLTAAEETTFQINTINSLFFLFFIQRPELRVGKWTWTFMEEENCTTNLYFFLFLGKWNRDCVCVCSVVESTSMVWQIFVFSFLLSFCGRWTIKQGQSWLFDSILISMSWCMAAFTAANSMHAPRTYKTMFKWKLFFGSAILMILNRKYFSFTTFVFVVVPSYCTSGSRAVECTHNVRRLDINYELVECCHWEHSLTVLTWARAHTTRKSKSFDGSVLCFGNDCSISVSISGRKEYINIKQMFPTHICTDFLKVASNKPAGDGVYWTFRLTFRRKRRWKCQISMSICPYQYSRPMQSEHFYEFHPISSTHISRNPWNLILDE